MGVTMDNDAAKMSRRTENVFLGMMTLRWYSGSAEPNKYDSCQTVDSLTTWNRQAVL